MHHSALDIIRAFLLFGWFGEIHDEAEKRHVDAVVVSRRDFLFDALLSEHPDLSGLDSERFVVHAAGKTGLLNLAHLVCALIKIPMSDFVELEKLVVHFYDRDPIDDA